MQYRTAFCAFCCPPPLFDALHTGLPPCFWLYRLIGRTAILSDGFRGFSRNLFGWPFCRPKKYRVKSLWFSSFLSHTLTYFFSFYLQNILLYIIYSLYIYIFIIIYSLYIYYIYYTRARAKSTLLYKAVKYVLQHIFIVVIVVFVVVLSSIMISPKSVIIRLFSGRICTFAMASYPK